MEAKRAKGVSSRRSETGEELMVPYDHLSEDAKELDRSSVRAVYDAIEALSSRPKNDDVRGRADIRSGGGYGA